MRQAQSVTDNASPIYRLSSHSVRPRASALFGEQVQRYTFFSNSDSALHKNNTFARPVTLFLPIFPLKIAKKSKNVWLETKKFESTLKSLFR